MFCQYCLSSEPYPLVGMQTHYLEQNGLQISYLDCFKQCKQIKIEDEQSAKICTNCIPTLTKEYTLKELKNDQANCEGSHDKNGSFQPEAEQNDESVNTNSIIDIKKEPTELQITISVANIEENNIKIEPSIVTASRPHQIVLIPVLEIKKEAELEIVDGADTFSLNLTTG
jgi:hypothetical protein